MNVKEYRTKKSIKILENQIELTENRIHNRPYKVYQLIGNLKNIFPIIVTIIY